MAKTTQVPTAAPTEVVRDRAHRALDEVQAREARWLRFFGPNAGVNEDARPSPEELLAIRRARPTDAELADAEEAARRAAVADDAARAEIRKAADAEIHQLERAVFTRITRRLREVRPDVDAWVALIERRQNEVGPIIDPIACRLVQALRTGTPESPALLDVWIEAGNKLGLLDSER